VPKKIIRDSVRLDQLVDTPLYIIWTENRKYRHMNHISYSPLESLSPFFFLERITLKEFRETYQYMYRFNFMPEVSSVLSDYGHLDTKYLNDDRNLMFEIHNSGYYVNFPNSSFSFSQYWVICEKRNGKWYIAEPKDIPVARLGAAVQECWKYICSDIERSDELMEVFRKLKVRSINQRNQFEEDKFDTYPLDYDNTYGIAVSKKMQDTSFFTEK